MRVLRGGPKERKNKMNVKPNEKCVSVFIPKESRIEVPERFAEVIENSAEMAAVSARYIDENISV